MPTTRSRPARQTAKNAASTPPKSRRTRRTTEPKRSPRFATREEEAAYWDSHSLADEWASSRRERVRFARNLSEGITIRLDGDTLDKLRSHAAKKGIGPTTLMRMWVMERIANESLTHARPRKRAPNAR